MNEFNKENFVTLLNSVGMFLFHDNEVKIETKENGDFIASAGPHGMLVNPSIKPIFIDCVSKCDQTKFAELLESAYSGVKYIPIVNDEEIVIEKQIETLEELPVEIKNQIESRVSSVLTIAAMEIKAIANLVNKRIEEVSKDFNIVKDFDSLLSFDYNESNDQPFKLFFCFDKIPPILDGSEGIEILRTPMTKADKKLYFGDEYPKIKQHLDNVNETINNFYQSKLVSLSDMCLKYAQVLVNNSVVKAFLDNHFKFISFGGVDNWRLFGDLTPNSKACHAIMDKEVEYLVNYLKTYRIPDHVELKGEVDFLSIDLNHLGIYARNNLFKLVSKALQEPSDHFGLRWSEGFRELMKIRLAQNDSNYCFYL
ncbi:hypothetical protein [Aeromonas phage ZPAH34]|uniref:hypothetical protein n=1 Tax=Aeromonas phage ZPAH34 TaxID=2924888 RepID=UPI0023292436|nr:hypothetical protein PQD16_gp191 [Aeromonas phage ZPAH34]UOX39492.1 hypothetical protein [Aeromonas phage ZPAH34]